VAIYVYIIESVFSSRRYIGQTDSLERRVAEHNNPEHNPRKYTSKHRGPWELIYYEAYNSRSEAIIRERWLKSGIGRRWINERFGRGRASPPKAD